jgi:tetratricopeptide (TPR) repeat protein
MTISRSVGRSRISPRVRSSVPILSRRIPYDRKRMLERADALDGTWRWRRALALYRQILAAEPHNADIHARVAPLLARSGRAFESWESFKIAIQALRKDGDEASARALQQQAVRVLPENPEACRTFARAELSRQKSREAIRVLTEGSRRLSRRFAPRRARGSAIVLLRDAREIEPWNVTVVLALCRLLAKDHQPAESLFLLDHLDQRVRGADLCAVRALTWRIEPSLRHSWRWLRAGKETRQKGVGGFNPPTPSRP